MNDQSFTIRVPRRWVRIAMIVGVTALIVAPLTAVATHSFDDVPNTNTFHADIEWLKDAGVTLGCNPPDNNLYCPEDNVTREQMSAFMRRLAENQVVDAGTLEGFTAADLVSEASQSADTSFINIPSAATTVVQTLQLTPGSYLVMATGIANNNAGTIQDIGCALEAGSASSDNVSLPWFLGPNFDSDKESFTIVVATTVDSTTDAELSCTTSAGWSGNVIDATISAISVDSATASVTSANDGGNGDG